MFQILVIDDDSSIQILLKRVLEKQGYQVIVANNGAEGIAKAYACPPAMIICDWMMPGMTGIDVCKRIKEESNFSTTFFILLTSLDSVADRVKGLDAGADEFISKPIEKNELEARVRAGLRLHQLSRDLQTQKLLLETELTEAAEYVKSLLPFPITQPFQISSRFIPSQQLGGDCFDYYWLDSNYLAIYLLDTAGHGLKATLPSISVLNLLRSRALKELNYYQPSNVLKALNDTFQMNYRNDKYFTIWYGVYNRVSRELIYASAGHPPAILISSDSHHNHHLKLLKTTGMPVGMFPEAHYVDDFCWVDRLSKLYIFSDGVYEITRQDGSLWDLDGFIQLLLSLQLTNDYQLESILNYLTDLNAKELFDDDLSILEVKFD